MNVKLAVQTLSLAVATAIDFLKTEVQLTEFEGREHMTKFICMIDTTFVLYPDSRVYSEYLIVK